VLTSSSRLPSLPLIAMSRRSLLGCLLVAALMATACGSQAASTASVVPQYNRDTGRLTSVEVDRDKDGKFEARAYMDGTRIQRVEIDANADGEPERWEYYGRSGPGGANVIERAEEAAGTSGKVSRWEYFERGQIARVDEDVDEDGRVDKWEKYRAGRISSVELDLSGSGKPERRLVYQSDGSVKTEAISEGAHISGS
jgi:hypothetical protein